MKTLQILIIVLILISCSNSEKKSKMTFENRIVYVFDLDSLKRNENYKLSIETKDSIIIYKYENPTDEEKNMIFRYNSNSKKLSFAFWEFELTEKNKYSESKISKMNFDYYQLKEPITDGNGPMLFNTDYGILNVDNGWGMKFIYLKSDNNSELTNSIIKTLND